MLSSRTLTLVFACSLVGGVAAAQGTAAQAKPAATTAQVDSRFAGWLGCWRLEDDLVGSNLRVCMTPEQTSGLKLQTIVGPQKGTTELMVPDNVQRAINDADCKGTEKSEWSKDGLRVFRYTNVTCGKEAPRKLSSVSFLMRGPTFVQVQFVESDQNKSVRVQRYRRAVDQTLADGTPAPKPSAAVAMAASSPDTPWDIDDVVEASAKLPPDAVQAALTEVSGPFQLNKKTLLAMSDGKVDASVIDLMVALTYPKKLVVNRAGSGYSGVSGISMGYGLYDPFMSPIIAASALYADCYSMYGSTYSSCGPWGPYYGLYGSGGYGSYGGYYPGYPYYGGGGWVVVDPGSGQPAPPQLEGRAIKGLGYTQIRPREPEPTPRIGNNGNATSGTNGTNSGSSNSGSSNGGSSGATSGGYSGGSSSSGSDGARIAVPRPPGGC